MTEGNSAGRGHSDNSLLSCFTHAGSSTVHRYPGYQADQAVPLAVLSTGGPGYCFRSCLEWKGYPERISIPTYDVIRQLLTY